ncbi:amino acid permease/ SLC12A domain-containing protein [Mariannaea sp. PMI_226]|nr:amino acid permease/ SLC12A domain-containing protein [Mariannaea sp. PMI_226]
MCPGIWIAAILAAITTLNIFGALGYAEEEFLAACFKLGSKLVFVIIALPSEGRCHEYWGARLRHEPVAFKSGYNGFCSVFVTAAFTFAETELVGLAEAESRNPTTAVPSAVKQIFWPSHFVLVGKYASLRGLGHLMNTVTLSSMLSIGIASVYGGSLTVTTICQQGYAPMMFTYIDRGGRSLSSVCAIITCGLLPFVNLSGQGQVVFNWVLSIVGLAVLFTWVPARLAHIRFRAVWKLQNHTPNEIPFKMPAVVNVKTQFYIAITAPRGESGLGTVEGFFMSYLGFPIVLVFCTIGYLWKR